MLTGGAPTTDRHASHTRIGEGMMNRYRHLAASIGCGGRATAGAVLSAFLLLLTVVLSACGSVSTPASSTKSGPLVVNSATALKTLDPAYTNDQFGGGIVLATYGTLTQVEQSPGGAPGITQQNLDVHAVKPYLAESWTITNGGRTITFHLRPGMKFPSGDPVNAQAVVWSLKRISTLQTGAYSNFEESQYTPPLVRSVTATGPLTVVIQYSRPAPNQLQVLAYHAGAVYDPALVERHGGMGTKGGTPNPWLATHSAGFGPYLVESYQPGRQLVLVANPHFFAQPKAKKVVLNFIPNDSTLLLDARSGEADITLGLSPESAHSLASNQCCRVVALTSRQFESLNLPETKQYPELENLAFRQALSYAVPYAAILKTVGSGYGRLFSGEWLPSFPFYDPSVGAPHPTDLAKAKQLIAASGVKTPVTFPIYVDQGDLIGQAAGTAVAGAWKALGVNAQVTPVSAADLQTVVYGTHAGPSLFLDGPYVVAPEYMWAYDLQCPPINQFNDTLICIPKADKLMRELPFVTSAAKQQEIINEVDEMYIAAASRIDLYNIEDVTVLNKRVTNYYSSDVPDMRFWGVG